MRLNKRSVRNLRGELDGKKASSIDLVKHFNLNDASVRDQIFAWYKDYTEKFINYFKPIVKTL